MNRQPTPKALRYFVCSALAAALVTGCAATGHLASAGGAKRAQASALSDTDYDRAVAKAEDAVAAAPRDAAAREALAHAYLSAGRFDSAATTFDDAIELGDTSPRTALSQALSYIGAGRNPQALAVLDKWRDAIPASDLGLALALAGQPVRGVAVLNDALRGGENTPKVRQNLAYAYALAGSWRDARVMAAMDLPADKLDGRLSEWALQGQPDDYGKRVAMLLGAPVRQDPGQPQALALGGSRAPVAETPSYAANDGELPPVDARSAPPAAPQVAAASAPAAPASPTASTTDFALAEMQRAPAEDRAPASAPVTATAQPVTVTTLAAAPRFVTPADIPASPPRRSVKPRVAGAYAERSVIAQTPAADCTHLVQLGSFSSEANAERAKNIFLARNPELKGHDFAITPAVVKGRKYWRVAASGFDSHSAVGMCTAVKGRGGGCIAYAATSPLPGALPGFGNNGTMLARR